MQQSLQLLLIVLSMFHPPAQPLHNCEYPILGSQFGAAKLHRHLLKAPLRSF
jgi:hypothetical protein